MVFAPVCASDHSVSKMLLYPVTLMDTITAAVAHSAHSYPAAFHSDFNNTARGHITC